MLRTTTAALASLALMTGTALAQTATTTAAPALVEIAGTVAVPTLNLTADQVEDLEVHSAEGVDIGDVEEVYGSDAQTPTHLAIDFDNDNGSPYADRDDVLVPLESVSLDNGRLVLALTPEQVAALPTHG